VNSITRYEQTLFAVHIKTIPHNDRAERNIIMKKTVTLLLILAMTLSFTACGSRQKSSSQTENSLGSETTESSSAIPIQTQTSSPAKLTNKMTENELEWVSKRELTLLDEFEKPNTDPNAEHNVSIEFVKGDTETTRKYLDENRDMFTDEEYDHELRKLKMRAEKGGDDLLPSTIIVDGFVLPYFIPAEDDFYDGGSYWFITSQPDENGEPELVKESFKSFEEYLEYVRDRDTEWGYSKELVDTEIMYLQIAYDALKSGDYETLPEGTADHRDDHMNLWFAFNDHRDDWEFDRDAVEAIKDSVDEIRIFDEEMGKEFTVHVTLPPDYDKDSTYPVFFLTDGIWRFGNCPELRKCMENGEAAPVILVSLYYSYDVTDPDQEMRYEDLVINRELLLNFITDNLMPYLCENYNIDCGNSTLYGHSDGGVFTHHALFNSDKYENQPFGHYIIGSPALWGLKHYNEYEGISNDIYMNDYGYFDRNDTLDKTVFLCAGSLEDPDYAENYREGDDTTLEGVAKLKERLEAHNAELTYKLYESHHYQYIPEMLIEFLKETYPC